MDVDACMPAWTIEVANNNYYRFDLF